LLISSTVYNKLIYIGIIGSPSVQLLSILIEQALASGGTIIIIQQAFRICVLRDANMRHVHLAYQPPANITFLSEQSSTSHQPQPNEQADE
jgi:hypothetical protein